MSRVLAAAVHIHTEEGTVHLKAGDPFPEQYADAVSNPACFVDRAMVDVVDPALAIAAQAALDAEAEAKVKADADAKLKAEADAAEKAKADAEAKLPAGDGTNGEAEGEKPVVYSEVSYPELQAIAKKRELPANGNSDTLIARLEADDRDKAAAAPAAE